MTSLETKQRMKNLSIMKWEYLAETGYSSDCMQKTFPEHIIEEIGKLENLCGFCELYESGGVARCEGCPLKDNTVIYCCEEYHDWSNASDNDKRKELARVMLDRIKSILVEEMP